MKAILDYNGFTKMVEVPKDRDTYEELMDVREQQLKDALQKGDHRAYSSLTSMSKASYKCTIFKKESTAIVDGEEIAIFKFYDEIQM